jgi:hypothetical protein
MVPKTWQRAAGLDRRSEARQSVGALSDNHVSLMQGTCYRGQLQKIDTALHLLENVPASTKTDDK